MIRLTLPFPVSVNAMYLNNRGKGKGRIKSPRYRAWIALCAPEMIKAKAHAIKGPYTLHMRFYAPDRRSRDCGNLEKGFSDTAVAYGLIEDDKFCRRMVLEWADEILAPGHVEIEIAPVSSR